MYKFPVIGLIGLVLMMGTILPIVALKRIRIDKISFVIFINFLYWFISAFLVNSISFHDLLNIDFWNGDGRIFIYYLPLLIFTQIPISESTMRSTIKIVLVQSIISFILLLIWLVTNTGFLSGGPGNREFFGFFTSHTGAGTYFGLLFVVLLALGINLKQKKYIYCSFLLVPIIFLTESRQTIIALMLVFLWYVLFKIKNIRIILLASVIFVAGIFLMSIVSPNLFGKFTRLINPETIGVLSQTAQSSNWEPGDERGGYQVDYNVESRMRFWNYAMQRFFQSPFFGVGFGRYNDQDIQMYGINGLFSIAIEGEKRFNAGSAHNSYLHMLAEGGLLGLILLMYIWYLVYKRFSLFLKYKKNLSAFEIGIFNMSKLLILYALVNALFGHALASPTLGLPLSLILGLNLAYGKTVVNQLELKDSYVQKDIAINNKVVISNETVS